MRIKLTLFCFLFSTIGISQDSIPFIEVKVGIQGGLDFPVYGKLREQPYGIDLAKKANAFGPTGGISLGFEFKRRIGLVCLAAFDKFSFRNKYFYREMADRFGSFYIQDDEAQDVTHSGGEGIGTVSLNPYLYFVINQKQKYKFVIFGGVNYMRATFSPYSYALRIPSTNYFTRYNLTDNPKGTQPLLNCGLEIRRTYEFVNEKGKISNLFSACKINFIFGKYTTIYTISTQSFLTEKLTEFYTLEHKLFFINLTFTANIFSL